MSDQAAAPHTARLPWRQFCFGAALAVLVLAHGEPAAAATAAGTVISETAAASYTNAAGTQYNVTSNTVTTTVQNAPSLTIADPTGVNVLPGATETDNFILTNSGNGTGTFALISNATFGGTYAGTTTLVGYILNGATSGTCSTASPCVTYTALNAAITTTTSGSTITVGVQYQASSTALGGQTIQPSITADIAYAAGTGTNAETSVSLTNATFSDTVYVDARLDLQLSSTQPTANAVIPYVLKVNNGGGVATTALNLSTPLSGVSATQGIFVAVPVPVWSSAPLAVSAVSTSVGNGYSGTVSVYYSTSSSGTTGWTTTAPTAGTAYFIGVYTSTMLPGDGSGSTTWSGTTAPTVSTPQITLNFSLAQPTGYAAGATGSVAVVANGVNGNNATTQQIIGPGSNSGTAYNSGSATAVIQGMIANTTSGSASTPGGSGYSNQTLNQANLIEGTVFEDINYGGGSGRSLASSSGAGVSGARVELYNSTTSAFVSFTTTASNGTYYFTPGSAATYVVRVVNSTVLSTRSGSTSTLRGVQTYRTDASSGSATAVTDHVGGENPAYTDAASNTTSATLSSLTSGSVTPESITTVVFASSPVSGVDFGFNFDTIVNTSATGQGSLAQFVLNASALSSTGLAQSGLTAGYQTSIFMITDGNAHPGLRSGLTSQLTSGIAVINQTTINYVGYHALVNNITIDGSTQSTNIGNTNNQSLGPGGTVGVDADTLPQLNGPEVQVTCGSSVAADFLIESSNDTIENLALTGTPINGLIFIDYYTSSGTVIQDNVIGSGATSFTDPGSGSRAAVGIYVVGTSTGGTIQNNLVGFTTTAAIDLSVSTASGWTVTGNYVYSNYAYAVVAAQSTTITQNLISNNAISGIDMGHSTGGAEGETITDNTITNNGIGTSSANAVEDAGIRVSESGACSTESLDSISKNIIYNNYGAGIIVEQTQCSTQSPVSISQNSIYSNGTSVSANGTAATGELGIDVIPYGGSETIQLGTSPFVTANASGDNGSGTLHLNFPVFDGAYISGSNLVLTGWAEPGSVMELYIAQAATNGFGQGKTYLTTLTEGSSSSPVDGDSTTGSYASPYNGSSLVGTDTTNRFEFSIPTPGGVSNGTVLTAFAKLNSNVSEFSQNITVSSSVPSTSVTLAKVVSPTGNQPPGTVLTYTTTFTNTGSAAVNTFSVVTAEPNNTDFQVGSASASLGSTNLTAAITYSNNSGSTYAYTPTSGGGGAPAGYDRTVTDIKYTFTGTLEQISPYNSGTFTMAARIQ